MKQMKEHRLYGLVLFLVILFLDVGNIFTRIGKRIGFYEFIVIMLVVAVMAGIYLRLRRWTKGYTIKQPNMDCQPTEITALMRHRAVFS